MSVKRRAVVAVQRYVMNPLARPFAGYLPRIVLLETTGRKTGRARRTPVGGRLEDDTVWVVAEHGRRAGYVRNLLANPRVRVRLRGRWREGRAHIAPDDNPRRRALWVSRLNGSFVRLLGTELLTIRIELEAPRGS